MDVTEQSRVAVLTSTGTSQHVGKSISYTTPSPDQAQEIAVVDQRFSDDGGAKR